MSAELEVAKLQGRVDVLEKLIMGALIDKILDAKLQAINAEAIAGCAFEQVQNFIGQASAESAAPGEEYGEGVVNMRTGSVSRQRKEAEDESS